MDTKNPIMVIVVIIITILIGISLMLGIANINLSNELNHIDDELDLTKSMLNDNISKLKETTTSINQTKQFFNKYLNGLGIFYNATLIQEKADYRLEQAYSKYDIGHLSNALAWYWDASDWFQDAWEQFNEAEKIFDIAYNYQINSTYLNICSIYLDIIEASANGMIYAKEASDLYADTCEFYLENDYKAAHESWDDAESKMSYHDLELEKVESYQEDLNIILSEIS